MRSEFIIYFDVEFTEENINWLVRFSFLTNYKKFNNALKVIVKDNNTQLITQALNNQGYSKIELIDITDIFTFSIDCIHGYMKYDSSSLDTEVILTHLSCTAQGCAGETCKSIRNINSYFHFETNLNQRLKSLMEENEQLENKVADISIELENNRGYLQIALNQKETETILKFYHQEYEVLPLWYKRFGHLIKIITGKRKIKTR